MTPREAGLDPAEVDCVTRLWRERYGVTEDGTWTDEQLALALADHQLPAWIPKITRNMHRDERVTQELQSLGWTVVRLWESDILKDVDTCARHVADTLEAARSAIPARRT